MIIERRPAACGLCRIYQLFSAGFGVSRAVGMLRREQSNKFAVVDFILFLQSHISFCILTRPYHRRFSLLAKVQSGIPRQRKLWRHFAGEMRNPKLPEQWGIRVWRFREMQGRGRPVARLCA